jgi:hypothetical protein
MWHASTMESLMLMNSQIRWNLFCFAFFFFILLGFGPSAGPVCAQTQPQNPLAGKNVLILHALEPMMPVFEKTDEGLSGAVKENSNEGKL